MKSFLFLFLFFSTTCFSQKTYQFDYLLEFEYTSHVNMKEAKKIRQSTIFYLTNSTNNEYYVRVSEKDSLTFRLHFYDYKGNISDVIVPKKDFFKAETFSIKCEYVSHYVNLFKYQTKHYDFYRLNDTVVENKIYKVTMLSSNKPKREKRKKLGKIYYFLDDSLSFHLPLFTFPTAYEEWKLSKSLLHGLYSKKLTYDYYGTLYFEEKLLNYYKIDKRIEIPSECDYSNEDNHLSKRVKIYRDRTN